MTAQSNEVLTAANEVLHKTVQENYETIEKLKTLLAESEEQYVALQKTNAENWTKCNTLEKDAEHLRESNRRLNERSVEDREAIQYWQGSYLKTRELAETQEAAYLKVIKTLGGRD